MGNDLLLFRNFRPRQTIIHFVSNDFICFTYHILNQSVKRLFESTIIKISTTYETEYQNIKKTPIGTSSVKALTAKNRAK